MAVSGSIPLVNVFQPAQVLLEAGQTRWMTALFVFAAAFSCMLLVSIYTLKVWRKVPTTFTRVLSCPVSPPPTSWSEPGKRTGDHEPPCAIVVSKAQAANIENGHENDGFLSYQAGFLPLNQPLLSFPPRYEAWDQLIRNMPELISSQRLQAAIEDLPVLPADQGSLPDKYLHRAATFFCIVAHAYVRLDGEAPLELVGAGGERRVHEVPIALDRPWKTVSERLGRELPFMSYIDLIVYNWRWRKDVHQNERDSWVLEKLKLLVPTVDNQEENVFYLTQLELLSKSSPLIRNIVDAQRAVLKEDAGDLKLVLREVISTLNKIGRGTLSKVSSRPSSKTYTDPVVWTKSVASLAIPLRSDVTGPTGTGSPFFHMMDEFLERSRHEGHLGQEYLRLRAGYPKHWKMFLEAIKKVSIKRFIEISADRELAELWDAVNEKYCGQFGVLGLHRRKVFAYLSTAFRIGRSTTIGGFKGKPSEEPWVKVHKELEVARQERCSSKGRQNDDDNHDEAALITSKELLPSSRHIPISEVLSHTTKSSRYWFSARRLVYDATLYASLHPGGDRIILVSSGRDISFDLNVIQHFSDPTISAQMTRFVIGSLEVPRYSNSPLLQKLYDFTVALGYRTADQQGTWTLDMSFLSSPLTRVDSEGHLTMQKGRYFERSWASLRSVYAPSVTAHMNAVFSTFLLVSQRYSAAIHGQQCKSQALLLRLDNLTAGVFPTSMADCKMGTLSMAKAQEMADATLQRLSRIRTKVVLLLQMLEGLPQKHESELLKKDFCGTAIELVSEVECLGTLD